ncbi:MAG: hypothetical protein RDU76_06965 [Candidatus Edwardsbacteria bacterium]|nr:hypothetical protein [Candidatus Edwardsbacteria bacterium]
MSLVAILLLLGCTSYVKEKAPVSRRITRRKLPAVVALDTSEYQCFLFYETIRVKIKMSYDAVSRFASADTIGDKERIKFAKRYRDTIKTLMDQKIDSVNLAKFKKRNFYKYSVLVLESLLDEGAVKIFDAYNKEYADSIYISQYTEMYDQFCGVSGRRFSLKGNRMIYETVDMVH